MEQEEHRYDRLHVRMADRDVRGFEAGTEDTSWNLLKEKKNSGQKRIWERLEVAVMGKPKGLFGTCHQGQMLLYSLSVSTPSSQQTVLSPAQEVLSIWYFL